MIESKRGIYNKLDELAALFRSAVGRKAYREAKIYYDRARAIASVLQIEEEKEEELFGVRGERGIEIKRGAFPEKDVLDVLYETCVRKSGVQSCYSCEHYRKNEVWH